MTALPSATCSGVLSIAGDCCKMFQEKRASFNRSSNEVSSIEGSFVQVIRFRKR